jgi:hypothetical protein
VVAAWQLAYAAYVSINVKPGGVPGKGLVFDIFLKKIVKIHTPGTPPLVKKL